MDDVARFAALVARPADEVALDEAALLIAAHARGGVDVDAGLAQLDALASRCEEHTFDGLRRHMFGREHFRGNVLQYNDPDNSFLDRVLDRRVGIPITLSAVMIELGRRIGVPIVGIGMPAHFIVRSAVDPDLFCDPFNGGQRLDGDGCAALFARVTQGSAPFAPSFLTPVTAPQMLSRMLLNLEHGPFGSDPLRLSALLDLHVAIPSLTGAERQALGQRLATLGRYMDAARVVESGEGPPSPNDARAYRARFN